MSKRPETQPVDVAPLRPWYPEEPGDSIEGQIVGELETDMGVHSVLETEEGMRFRLPTHVDLCRRLQAVRMSENEPWVAIHYTGIGEDDKTKMYRVQHYPEKK